MPREELIHSTPATLGEALDQLADRLGAVAAGLRALLADGALFDGVEHHHWELLIVLNSLGLHEGTVRELRRILDRRGVTEGTTR